MSSLLLIALGFVLEKVKTRAAARLDFFVGRVYNLLHKKGVLKMEENMEERPEGENRIAIMARLPKRAEAGFESWRKYLGMTKGAFAVLAIRVGMAHMGDILPDNIAIPPEDALEIIDREAPDEKEY